MPIGRIILGRSVGKITIMNLSFRVDTFENKNIEHSGKETYAMFCLLIQNKNNTTNATLPFLFDFFELKEKYHIKRKISY